MLFGGNDVDNEERTGGRFTLGMWLDACEHFGIEGSYLFLSSRSVTFDAGTAGTAGTPVLGRPFFDLLTGAESAQVFASPNMMAGTIHIDLSSRLQGYELNGLYNLGGGCCDRLDLLAGFRYLQLEGAGRDRRTAAARQLAMYLLREDTSLSLADIGTLLGGRDHSTVLHGHGKINGGLAEDEHLRESASRVGRFEYKSAVHSLENKPLKGKRNLTAGICDGL